MLIVRRLTVWFLPLGILGIHITPRVFAMECPKPAAQVAEDVKLDIKGAVDIGILRALKAAGGELDAQFERKVQDLFSKYPNADKLVLQSWTISMICQQLAESKQLSDQEKLEKMFGLHREISGIFESKVRMLSQLERRLESGNRPERLAAVADALVTGDPELQHVALAEIFASGKNFPIRSTWKWATGATQDMSALLIVENFDKKSGDLLGMLTGSDISPYNARADKFRGRLIGTTLDGTNGKCSLSVSLETDKEMLGSLRCLIYGGDAIMRIR